MASAPLIIEVAIILVLLIMEPSPGFTDRAKRHDGERVGGKRLKSLGAFLAYLVDRMTHLCLGLHIEGIVKDASIFEKHEEAAYDFCL